MNATPLRIIIVEDEAFVAMWLEQELTQSGFAVLGRVATGEAAVELAAEVRPEACLFDIRLAGDLDGIDAARRVRQFCDAKIIFMTGYPDSAIESRARELHPTAYLVKPVKIRQLQRVLSGS
ncbi:MAG: response regulator [Spirochaetaceae bacterium]